MFKQTRLRNALPAVWLCSFSDIYADFFIFIIIIFLLGAISDAVKVELSAGFDKHDPYQECQIQLQTLPVQQGAAVHK